MAIIELKDVAHSYELDAGKEDNWTYAVEDINLKYEDGTAAALLGPSGCGKTTILQIISGLITPTKGRVLFDGKDVTELNTKQRHIAQVFQFPVVYDSMNVYGNIAFPLKNDGEDDEAVRKQVYKVAEIMEIEHMLKVPAGKLNPADKQKVSLGRGIVRPNTAAVLLDEPLTVIDPKAQWGLRRKLKEIQKELNFTMIYVTHDQHEALTFADEVTVMQVGHVDQVGTPEELHDEPQSTFVGFFIGSPGMNMFQCLVEPDGTVQFKGHSVKISKDLASKLLEKDNDLTLGIRPEYITTYKEEKANTVSGTVKLVEDTGAYKIVTTSVESTRDVRRRTSSGDYKTISSSVEKLDIKSRAPETFDIKEGDTAWLELPEEHLKFYKDGKKIS